MFSPFLYAENKRATYVSICSLSNAHCYVRYRLCLYVFARIYIGSVCMFLLGNIQVQSECFRVLLYKRTVSSVSFRTYVDTRI